MPQEVQVYDMYCRRCGKVYPIHMEVVYEFGPGKCPDCKVKLVPRPNVPRTVIVPDPVEYPHPRVKFMGTF